ncbi:DUF3887 domain-containing protein [Candidatus Sumerlaeota bacterium]|nr:DUF3887 domain-containing protein [Candidatus Sumerlaeota bacterium]
MNSLDLQAGSHRLGEPPDWNLPDHFEALFMQPPPLPPSSPLGFQAPKKGNTGRFWLMLGMIGAVCFIAVAGGSGYFIYSAQKRIRPEADHFLQTFQASDFEAAYELTGKRMKRDYPKERVLAIFRQIEEGMGKLDSYSFRNIRISTNSGGSKIATYQFSGKFANGAGLITITLEKEEDRWTVIGFHVNSPRLEKYEGKR